MASTASAVTTRNPVKTFLSFAALLAGGLIFQKDLWDFSQLDYHLISGNMIVGSALIVSALTYLCRR